MTSTTFLNADNSSTLTGVNCIEDNDPISETETEFLLRKGEDKQFEGYLVLDYTGSMQAGSDAIEDMEDASNYFATNLTGDALLGVYEYHVENKDPRKIIGFSKDRDSLRDKINAISAGIGSFYGGSRCWDAVYAAVEVLVGHLLVEQVAH